MRVLLISPAMKNYRRISEIPIALVSIATYLSQRGHTVKVVDRLVKTNSIEKIIDTFQPDFVGITLMYVKTIEDAMYCSEAAHGFGATVVWGGHLASDAPTLVLKETCVDFVIMGEGEYAWEELLNAHRDAKGYNGIKGLAYKENLRVIINPCREYCDLSKLPPLDFGFINPPDYFQTYHYCKRQLHLYTSKGCPGRCAFCFNPHFNNSVHRIRPLEHVLGEVRCLVNDYGADGIYFQDEILRTNSRDVAEVCEAFRNAGLNFVWGCKMRIGVLSKEDFKVMYDSGCRWIFFGVETASPEMCKSIHKGITVEQVKEDIDTCAKAGILPVSSFIIGLPDETPEQLKQTVALAQSLSVSLTFCGYFVLWYASEYYEQFVKEGRVLPPQTLRELLAYPIIDDYFKTNYSKIPDRDLKVVRAYFFWWSFRTKTPSEDTSRHSLTKKAFKEYFGTINRLGLFGFINEAYSAFFTAMSFGIHLFCFPRIKRRYGLTLNRKPLDS